MELVTLVNGVAVVSSAAVADGTENQHKNVMELIRTYQSDLEEFGGVAFETQPFETAEKIVKALDAMGVKKVRRRAREEQAEAAVGG